MRGALLFFVALLATPAFAQDTVPYLDDRSDPGAVIRSYYNAINRGELSRAYSYFGEGDAPDAFAAFSAGYADTAFVDVAVGDWTEEGAMSSVYYAVPVAIDAEDTAGRHKQFAGCYTVRLTQPNVQDPPVVPMHIEKGSLHAVHGKALEALLPDCPL